MQVWNSLETISGMILNQLQKMFAARSVANEKLCMKAMERPALTVLASFGLNSKIF